MKIKKGDKVFIELGKDSGKTGVVSQVLVKEGKLIVSGINKVKKHLKARGKDKVGGITEMEKPVNASNVMVICPACGKKTRVSYSISGKNKERVCKKCKQSLENKKEK